MNSTVLRFDQDITEDTLLGEVQKLNEDDSIDGFIVQLPLPNHINSDRVLQAIDPAKDVDGFHPINIGRMTLNLPSYLPRLQLMHLVLNHGSLASHGSLLMMPTVTLLFVLLQQLLMNLLMA